MRKIVLLAIFGAIVVFCPSNAFPKDRICNEKNKFAVENVCLLSGRPFSAMKMKIFVHEEKDFLFVEYASKIFFPFTLYFGCDEMMTVFQLNKEDRSISQARVDYYLKGKKLKESYVLEIDNGKNTGTFDNGKKISIDGGAGTQDLILEMIILADRLSKGEAVDSRRYNFFNGLTKKMTKVEMVGRGQAGGEFLFDLNSSAAEGVYGMKKNDQGILKISEDGRLEYFQIGSSMKFVFSNE